MPSHGHQEDKIRTYIRERKPNERKGWNRKEHERKGIIKGKPRLCVISS